MAENVEIEKVEKTPLLKQKKPRPPQSEKQMENFKAMQEIRAKKTEERKQAKILEAQRALLEKEGYVKSESVPNRTQLPQFEIKEEEEEEEELIPKVKGKVLPKQKIKEIQVPIQTPKIKRKPKVIEPESESDECDSDSSEEVIIIKRKSKKVASKRSAKQVDEEGDEYIANPHKYEKEPHIDYGRFFC